MAVPGLGDAARSVARLAEERGKDLDETRRLLYMALVCGKTKRYNLAGTLINAMRHHQGVEDAALEERILGLVDAVELDPDDEAWARGHINRLTDGERGG